VFKKAGNLLAHMHSPIEYDLAPYQKVLDDVERIKLSGLSDKRLREMSEILKRSELDKVSEVEAFALAREAARRVLGLRMFDVQVLAGAALSRGKIVEMQTGEGKTLAAVLPAYAHALGGRGVHILTFNGYLARRDREWMGPVYEFLGLTVGCVQEGMSINERQRAYAAEITYMTAKEAGFDYLRDFLCTNKDDLVQRPFHYAIVDEADSILIDEARIPLVIAGDVPDEAGLYGSLPYLVRGLRRSRDYEVDTNECDIFLTDAGLARVERALGCGNLYDPKHLELLTRVNCALHAEVLLQRDRDYIVRNGKIELIDEFTGRVADKRHWPNNLQAAVVAKEGLMPESSGKIMGSVTVQNYIGLYPKMGGMTGTAKTAAAEFFELYEKFVAVIPTNKPCIRRDYPDSIYTHREARYSAVIAEIIRAQKKGRPVLVGTASVAESERLAEMLRDAKVKCRLLNAKNDEMEAKIIAGAGEHGAVTVSTNMAGRGVDIKLGGEGEQERERVVAAGGLYVIGTTRYESRRIDDQLRGRAGRQGDPGESRFFISLDDDLIQRYEIDKLIPADNYPLKQDGAITDSVITREIAKGQRFVEGYQSQTRLHLYKYSYVLEQQRQIIHKKRKDVLLEREPLRVLVGNVPEQHEAVCRRAGDNVVDMVERELTLYFINKNWSDYLNEMACVRESIHLVVMGKQNPLDEFHRAAIKAFEKMIKQIDEDVVQAFLGAEITTEGINMEREGLKRPSSTWTYLVNDCPDQYSRLPELLKGVVAVMRGPLFSASAIYSWLFKKRK
jgi:preprotein translocase subunit SecA